MDKPEMPYIDPALLEIPKFKPVYDSRLHSRNESFERTALRTLVKAWFPYVSFAALEKSFLREFPDDVINYTWLSERMSLQNASPPDLSFVKDNTPWQLNLHELLVKPIVKYEIYRKWEEQPSDGLVFPIIGKQAILYEADTPPLCSCVVQLHKGGLLIIAELGNYASLFKGENIAGD